MVVLKNAYYKYVCRNRGEGVGCMGHGVHVYKKEAKRGRKGSRESSAQMTKARGPTLIGVVPRLPEGWGGGEGHNLYCDESCRKSACHTDCSGRGCSATSFVNSSCLNVVFVLNHTSSLKSQTASTSLPMPSLWSSVRLHSSQDKRGMTDRVTSSLFIVHGQTYKRQKKSPTPLAGIIQWP
jgi:hypothetical protein